jgi:hypothetical protein
MAFKRKGAPSAKSLDLGSGAPYAGDQNCPGNSPVNKSGQVTDKQGQVQNWPYQRHTVDNELNPRSNQGKPDQLSENPQAYGDFSVDGKVGGLNGLGKTLG